MHIANEQADIQCGGPTLPSETCQTSESMDMAFRRGIRAHPFRSSTHDSLAMDGYCNRNNARSHHGIQTSHASRSRHRRSSRSRYRQSSRSPWMSLRLTTTTTTTTSQACRVFHARIGSSSDTLAEPAIFVASSLVHFNDAHRAGIIRNAQQSSSSASASASIAQKSPSNGRSVNALASSSGRVVNAATTRGLPTGNNLRSWIVQPGAHRGTSADDSPSKGKGKAKATEPAAGRPPRSPIKLEPGPHVKLEPPLTALPSVVRPKGKNPSSAVKMEPTSTPSMPPPYPRGQPVLPPVKPEPHTADDWGRRSAAAMVHPRGIVKAEENSSAYVSGPLIPKCSPRSSPAHGRPSSSGPSIPSSSRSSSSKSSPATPSADASANSTAVKRRLGMGRATGGYANKKFKPMLPGGS